MPEIVFYILATAVTVERDIFLCKLVEKAYRQGKYSAVLTASDAHSEIMDDLLWTYQPVGFIPHQQVSSAVDTVLPQITLSADPACLRGHTVLINTSSHYPEPLTGYQRVLEILYQNPAVLQAGRERYRRYQQAGATLTTHKL